MSFPKYFITYTIMTEEAGANPFWHVSLLLSVQEAENKPVEVKDAFGFYSTFPSSTTNDFIKSLKTMLGFKVDLQDSHGHLEQEKMRFLNGQGLKGLSFEVEQTKYEALIREYNKAKKREEKAIKEYNKILIERGKKPNGHTRWLLEQEMLRNNPKQKQRLYPFHIEVGFNLNYDQFGFTTEASATCKSRALNLLRKTKIIDDDLYKQLSGDTRTGSCPRCGDVVIPDIQLISTGRPKKEKKFFNHVWKRNHLYWTHHPRVYTPTVPERELTFQNKQYQVINNICKRMNDVELALTQKIAAYKKEGKKGIHYQQCNIQRERINQIKKQFKANDYNQSWNSLISRVVFAEKLVNTAHMTLNADKVNYSFLQRAIENISLRYAMLGLLLVIASPLLLTGAVGLAATVAANCFTGLQFYKAIQTEIKDRTMRNHYQEYQELCRSKRAEKFCSSDSLDTLIDENNGLQLA